MNGKAAVISGEAICAAFASVRVRTPRESEHGADKYCVEAAGHEPATDNISSSVTTAAPDSVTLQWLLESVAVMSSSTRTALVFT